jgi:hypothetical protein
VAVAPPAGVGNVDVDRDERVARAESVRERREAATSEEASEDVVDETTD